MYNRGWDEFKAISEPIQKERSKIIEKSVMEDGNRTLWIGYHDCREAVKNTIYRMQNLGKFCPVWKECAFSWLTTYADHKGHNMNDFTSLYDLTKKRLSKMPKEVVERLGAYKE